MEYDLEGILIPIAFFLFVAYIVRQANLRGEHETQRRFELGVRTLDRFNDPEALDKFLRGAAGQEFMRLLDHGESPVYRRLLRSVQGGIALLAFGFAFLVLSVTSDELRDMVIPGTLFVSLGASLIIGAAVARKLAVRWDILGEPRGRRNGTPYRDAAAP